MILPVEVLNILATFYVSIYREALSGCRLLPLICVGIEPDPIYQLAIPGWSNMGVHHHTVIVSMHPLRGQSPTGSSQR